MAKRYYLVRFKLYHYNSGSADNGVYEHTIKTMRLSRAKKLASEIEQLSYPRIPYITLEDVSGQLHFMASSNFAGKFCWDGYIKGLVGVYEVRPLEIENW